MEVPYKCSFCGAIVEMADINPAKDIALCRSCGKTSQFSAICGAAKIRLDSLDRPPRGIRVQKGLSGETKIRYHRLSPALLFLIPFTAIWSGGSIGGIYGSQLIEHRFDLSQSLFGIPFAIGSIVLLTVIAYMAFGQCTVTMRNGKGSVFRGVGPIGWTRPFTYNRNTQVSLRIGSTQVNHVPQEEILVTTDGKDFAFGAMWKDPVKQYVAAAILREASYC